MKSCVYLTVYSGNKLPPFYIGSSYLSRIFKGYRGTPTSQRYAHIWNAEAKANPHLFTTRILQTYDTRSEALLAERRIQEQLNVVKNPLYVNMALAGPKFVNTECSPETRVKISLAKTGTIAGPRSDSTKAKISGALTGKTKSAKHRQSMSLAKTGVKQDAITVERRRNKLIGQKRTAEHCQKFKDAWAKMTESQRAVRVESVSIAQRARHANTIVTLKNPDGVVMVGNSLEDMCKQYNLYTTSMLRTLNSGAPLKHGPNIGWQLMSIKK